MKTYHLKNSKLIIHDNYLELQLLHECHFDVELFLQAFQIKKKHFKDQKIGVLIIRQDVNHAYSFDPAILLEDQNIVDNHAKWVGVISAKINDLQNLEYVKMLTKVPCYSFESYEDFESKLEISLK